MKIQVKVTSKITG